VPGIPQFTAGHIQFHIITGDTADYQVDTPGLRGLGLPYQIVLIPGSVSISGTNCGIKFCQKYIGLIVCIAYVSSGVGCRAECYLATYPLQYDIVVDTG